MGPGGMPANRALEGCMGVCGGDGTCIYIIDTYIYIYVDVPLMLCGKALQKGLSAAGGKFQV